MASDFGGNHAPRGVVNCPACLSGNVKTQFSVSSKDSARHFVPEDRGFMQNNALRLHIEQLWDSGTCEVVNCRDCGFSFANPFVAGDAKFYDLAYGSINYPSDKWEYDRTLATLYSLKRTGVSSLEIGAGTGYFLQKVAKFIDLKTSVATEYNAASLTKLRDLGVDSISVDLRDPKFPERRFDYIFMFQVVEHMADLDDLFSALKSHLAPDGSIFVGVPNQALTSFQEESGSLLDMPPNHVGRWTKDAFDALATRHGLKIEEFEVEPFSWRKFMRQDLFYSHLRRAQTGSVIDKLARSQQGRTRKIASAIASLLGAPRRVATWARASLRKDLGGSVWVHIRSARPE